MREFSNTWFEEQTRPHWQRHLLPLTEQIDSYLEIGCCEGASMCWVMENLQPSKAVAIDPWRAPKERQRAAFDEYRSRFYRNVREYMDRLFVTETTSYDFLTIRDRTHNGDIVSAESIALAFIDGSHYAWDVMTDCCLVWPKLRRGGIIAFDDLHRRWHHGKPLVLPAVHAFMSVFDSRYKVLYIEPRSAAFVKIK